MDRERFAGVRTLLFLAGHLLEKAQAQHADQSDVWILDLEDMVPMDAKAAGRRAVSAIISGMSAQRRARTFLRPSLADGKPHPLDVALAAGLAGLVLPKAESADQVARAADLAVAAGASGAIIPTVETARGIMEAHEIAAAYQSLGLIFGPSDLSVDLGVPLGAFSASLAYARAHTVLCAVASGVLPIDGAYLPDDEGPSLREEILAARALGYQAKLVVHAHHVPIVNELLAPSRDEQDEAARITAAAPSSESPIAVAHARRILARADAVRTVATEPLVPEQADSQ
ncbi:MAG: HpcH/HpaI aldolase/citrate lyase family protein [Candidatus Limnocylindrales bacterium]